MHMNQRSPQIWCYARPSDPRRQLPSAERQEADTIARARQIEQETEAVFARCRTDKMSASKYRYHQRPEFAKLM